VSRLATQPRTRAAQVLKAGLALGALGTVASASGADIYGPGVTTSHGYAVFGGLKYKAGFKHFDYVNPEAPKGGEYRFAVQGTFDSLNPVSLLGTFPPALLFVSDSLMRQSHDEPASFYCLICTTVSWPEDHSWVEFELDPRARFNDGTPITVDDVLYSARLEGLTVPSFSRVPQIVERAEQTGENRVRFHFKMKGNPTLTTVVGLMPIVPKHDYGQREDPVEPTLIKPVMASPYRVGAVAPGRHLVLERDPNYWAADHPVNKGRWNFDELRVDYYRDASMLNEAFLAGLNDLRVETSAANMRQQRNFPAFVDGDIKRDVLDYENGAVYNSLTINLRVPFLADRRVREALVLAFDYEWTKQIVLGGDYGRLKSYFPNSDFKATGLPEGGELELLEKYRGILPPEIFTRPPWLPTGGSWAKMRHNLLKARDLLSDAGYEVIGGKLIDPKTSAPVTLELLAYSPVMMNQMGLFISNMAKLGIEVNFRSVDSAQLRHLMRNYDYELLLYPSRFAPVSTPGVGMLLIWTSEAADKPSLLNYSGVKHPAIDEAMKRMVTATDRQTVVDMMRVVDRIARWEFYSVPLSHSYPTEVGRLPISYWDRFGRPEVEPTYNFPIWTADTWWYDPAKATSITHGANR